MAENHFKNTKILCMTLLCEQDPWFSIISNTTSLASKYNWAKQIGLCADHLTEGAKFTRTWRRRPALEALKDYPEAKLL